MKTILITNDDSIHANGIAALAAAVQHLGNVVVVAPEQPQSGQSGAITSTRHLALTCIEKRDNYTAYTVNGTPVDCVKLAMHTIFEDKAPDLLLSGINHGSNAGVCILYSGTMGAALEGCLLGIPSIGFSLCDHRPDADFTPCIAIIEQLAKQVLDEGLPKGICLNVNIPVVVSAVEPKVCRQARGYWTDEYCEHTNEQGDVTYSLTGYFNNTDIDSSDTDEWALSQGYISIVPCLVDLTAHDMLDNFDAWVKK